MPMSPGDGVLEQVRGLLALLLNAIASTDVEPDEDVTEG